MDHSKYSPSLHDRSLPDDNHLDEDGQWHPQWVAADGLMACNDCKLPMFYCQEEEE